MSKKAAKKAQKAAEKAAKKAQYKAAEQASSGNTVEQVRRIWLLRWIGFQILIEISFWVYFDF